MSGRLNPTPTVMSNDDELAKEWFISQGRGAVCFALPLQPTGQCGVALDTQVDL